MPFLEKLALAKHECIVDCRELISSNWENIVLWLPSEAFNEFFSVYKTQFRKEFQGYITNTIRDKLDFAVKNLIFSINAFILYTDEYELDDVLDFTECFINTQLSNFAMWCEDDDILAIE
jgi:hypothetical protein